MSGLARIEAWLNRRGLELIVSHGALPGALYDPDNKRVIIPARRSRQTQIALALHECGHVLIDSRENKRESKIDTLLEEVEAWHRGRRLARRLGVRVDPRAFARMRATCLTTYATWIAKSRRAA